MARRAGTVPGRPRLHLDGHGRLGEPGDELADRRRQRQAAFLHQRQDRDARQRFRLRRDAEDRVDAHLTLGFLVAPAEGPFVDGTAVAQHERDGAADAMLVDVLLQHAIDAGEAIGGESVVRLAACERCVAETGERPRTKSEDEQDSGRP